MSSRSTWSGASRSEIGENPRRSLIRIVAVRVSPPSESPSGVSSRLATCSRARSGCSPRARCPRSTSSRLPSSGTACSCTRAAVRNEYHEYRVEERDFGDKGCLFFYLGCRGPLSYGPCNKLLWNRRSSKTRVGVPCFGCTDPTFPQPRPFFKTVSIADIPLELPAGVDRAHYLAYKGMAAAAAPRRLSARLTRV